MRFALRPSPFALLFAVLLSTCSPLLADPPTTTHQSVWLDSAQTITGNKTFTGTTDLTSGTFKAPGGGTLTIGSGKALTINNSFQLNATDGGNFTFPAVMSGMICIADAVETISNKTIAASTIDLTNSSNTVTLVVPGGGGATRALTDVVLEKMKTPQDYGAIGDGSTHPISGTYATLAAAQAFYTFSIPNCGTTNTSTTVTCNSTVPLQAGYPVAGTGIPANTTISSITDGTHFVISNAATATGTVTLTSSFVTSTAQEKDWAGAQACVYANAHSYFPPGDYLFGSSTLRTTNAVPLGGQTNIAGDGITINGAGPQLTRIRSTGDAVHILGRYQKLENMSFAGPANIASNVTTTANGVTLGEGNYSNNFHAERLSFYDYNIGLNNSGDGASNSGWDGSSAVDCYFKNCQIAVHSYANQDWFSLDHTTIDSDHTTFAVTGASTTNGNNTITVASTTAIPLGATVSGTNIPARTYVIGITDSTHFTTSQNSTGTGSGITLSVATIGIYANGGSAVHWNEGVAGGCGVALVNYSSGIKSTGNHFEGADQTYCYGFANSGWIFEAPQFSDGSQSLVHLETNNNSRVFVTGAGVANAGLSYADTSLMYVLTHGNVTCLSPDHTAIEDWNGALQVVMGDDFIQGGDNLLPTISAGLRGVPKGEYNYGSYGGPDVVYVPYSIGGTMVWTPYKGTPDFYRLNPATVGPTTVSDGVISSPLNQVNSASANFSIADVGATVTGDNISGSKTIVRVTSSTSAILSGNTTGTGTSLNWTLTRFREGQIYMDSSDHHLKVWNGTTWKQLDN